MTFLTKAQFFKACYETVCVGVWVSSSKPVTDKETAGVMDGSGGADKCALILGFRAQPVSSIRLNLELRKLSGDKCYLSTFWSLTRSKRKNTTNGTCIHT